MLKLAKKRNELAQSKKKSNVKNTGRIFISQILKEVPKILLQTKGFK
jgi:hypothetical protein